MRNRRGRRPVRRQGAQPAPPRAVLLRARRPARASDRAGARAARAHRLRVLRVGARRAAGRAPRPARSAAAVQPARTAGTDLAHRADRRGRSASARRCADTRSPTTGRCCASRPSDAPAWSATCCSRSIRSTRRSRFRIRTSATPSRPCGRPRSRRRPRCGCGELRALVGPRPAAPLGRLAARLRGCGRPTGRLGIDDAGAAAVRGACCANCASPGGRTRCASAWRCSSSPRRRRGRPSCSGSPSARSSDAPRSTWTPGRCPSTASCGRWRSRGPAPASSPLDPEALIIDARMRDRGPVGTLELGPEIDIDRALHRRGAA